MTAFLATMMALGGIAAFDSLLHGVWAPSAELLLLIVLACVTAPHSLDLGHNVRISILHPYLIAAIVLLGTSEAVIVAGVSMVYFWIVSRPRLATLKAIFNLCNYLVAAWIAAGWTVRDALRQPFYHPTLEEALRSALLQLARKLGSEHSGQPALARIG